MPPLFDVHSHQIQEQTGGLILSIEGTPTVPGGLTYPELLALKVPDGFLKVPYVHRLDLYREEPIIYLHPRRNGYAVKDVAEYLRGSEARVVVLDTFSSFLWSPAEYFDLLRRFPQKHFLLAHGGGYQIRDFVQIARFSPNAFIDFSATQEIFGCVDHDARLDAGTSRLIEHCLAEPRLRKKLLFGSDNPEFSQSKAIRFYLDLEPKAGELFADNYQRLTENLQ